MSDSQADVVVAGFGGAGAATAIEAHDAGASVVILEKTGAGGGTTRESSGNMRIIADREKAANHYRNLAMDATPLSMMQVFATDIGQIPEWIESLGGTVEGVTADPIKYVFPYTAPTTSYPNIVDSDGIGGRFAAKAREGEGGGAALWRVLDNAVRERGIRVIYNVRAHALVKRNGQIVGVRATTQEGEQVFWARRAVVLTCGGFSYNSEMQKQFIGMELAAFSPPGRNTGDGIKMAQDAGADLWHMTAAVAGFGYRIPGFEAAFCAAMSSPGFLIVDQKARRFMDEGHVEFHSGLLSSQVVDSVEGRRLRLPSFLIFDEATRLAGPIVTRVKHSYNQQFPWSEDNAVELEKGWISFGHSVAELAEKLGLPGDRLEAAIARFNEACVAGDGDFGRKRELMRPVQGPPYYGIQLWPALSNTLGGPRRNERARVIDVFGNEIPRLYSAGELGSIWNTLYPGAGNVGECMVFGRIAGRNAAGETPIDG